MTARHYRPLWQTLLLVSGTVVAGFLVRFAPLGLPSVILKYGGSALWALTIYWIVAALLRTSKVATGAFVAGCIAAAVEFFKLYHSSSVDAFRLTLPGILLLGRFFSIWTSSCTGPL